MQPANDQIEAFTVMGNSGRLIEGLNFVGHREPGQRTFAQQQLLPAGQGFQTRSWFEFGHRPGRQRNLAFFTDQHRRLAYIASDVDIDAGLMQKPRHPAVGLHLPHDGVQGQVGIDREIAVSLTGTAPLVDHLRVGKNKLEDIAVPPVGSEHGL